MRIQVSTKERAAGGGMRQLYQEVVWFLKQKEYLIPLCLSAVFAYGFEIVHPMIGIDDTAVELYLQDGLEVVMGRWTIFLLNKVFHVAEFAPFMPEIAGVLLLMLSAALFCVLLKRIWGDRAGIWGYTLFSCVFVTCPIISEVYIYYYHDGIGVGYCMTALSLLLFHSAMEAKSRCRRINFLYSMLAVWIAVGCYESFLILYILGILLLLFLEGMADRERLTLRGVTRTLLTGGLLTVLCVALRSVMIQLVTWAFNLSAMEGLKPQRSLLEMNRIFWGDWGREWLKMLIKRFWLVYHVNALVYFPISVYEAVLLFFGALSILLAVRKKNIWYPVLFAGMYVTPFLLTLAESDVTKYRSCQYMPFFTAAGGFCVYLLLRRWFRRKPVRYIAVIAGGILIFNQASYLNRSFYEDYLKYEDTRETLFAVANEIRGRYGNESPVIFTGYYDTPLYFRERYYADFDSEEFALVASVTDLLDEHLKEKYYTDHGYGFAGEAENPFILWAMDAFDGTNREMLKFYAMHGYDFTGVCDEAILEQARQTGDTMPSWPAEGSISQQDGYVLVHF